jgi:ATP-binding cassette, subfamily B, bacterial HlyB/CyaB
MPKEIITARESNAEDTGSAPVPTSLLALAAIATRFGMDVNADQLRRRFALLPGEPDSTTLIALAHGIGLEATLLRMTFQDLPKVARALPAILRARDGGALILEEARTDPTKGTVAVIRDPSATEDVVVAIDELHLAEVWEGEAILLKRRHASTDEQRPFNFAWLMAQVMRERKLFFGILLAAFVGTLFIILPAFVVRLVLDRVIVNQSYSTLAVMAAAVVLMIGFDMVLSFVRRILTEVLTTRIDGRMGLHMLERVLRLPMAFFERTPTGLIVTSLQQVQIIRNFISDRFLITLVDIVPLLLLIPVLVIIEWHMALMSFALAGVIFVIVLAYLKPMRNQFRKLIQAAQARGSHLNETLYGMKTIKSLSLEGRRRRDWDRLVANVITARHELGLLSNYPDTLALPFSRMIQSGSMFLGAYLYLTNVGTANANAITPGDIVAFYILSARLAQPVVNLAQFQRELAEARGSISIVASIVDAPPEDIREGGLRQQIKGEVSFQDVRFRYSPEAPYALGGVSFTVPPGSMLGIMGRSGSGKTTVTRLLQCLNTNYDGMIKIDGMDLREINLMHLRTHIGVVPQENFLFSGSIRENIAMAKPDSTFAQVVRAAQISGAEEFIEKLPRGYDTPIQEGGSNLSGGQRQRLALARALLIDPPVLILDEATSALDAESEAIVNANLKRMAKGRTVLSISHRLAMLVDCDAILVMDQGKIYDTGTHEELLRRCDIYKHMWHQQNRHLDPRAADLPLVLQASPR